MSFSFKFYILALVLLFNINACVNNEINNSILFEEVNTKKQLNKVLKDKSLNNGDVVEFSLEI